MRILHIGKFYPPHMGGIEIYLQQIIRYQARSMDVAAIVANDSSRSTEEYIDGAKIVRAGSFGLVASMPVVPTMAWHIRREPADLVHLHTPNPGAALSLLLSGHTGKFVITHHSDTLGRGHLRWMSDPFVHKVMQRAAAIIVTSQGYLDGSEELAPYRSKCSIIPMGVQSGFFEQADAQTVSAIRRQYGDRLVLAVGRLVQFKGFECLIKAMTKVRGKLILIGDGPLRKTLHARIRELGLQEKVVMIANVDNAAIAPYYLAADIFVMSSITRAESFGIVQVEAMASGIPVINTHIPSGVPDISIHGETGLTVPPNDSDALANAINTLLDNRDLRVKFGTRAREIAIQNYSFEKIAESTMSLYRKVLEQDEPT